MKHLHIHSLYFIISFVFLYNLQAQNLKADFNALPLNAQGYFNGSDGSGGFASGGLYFKNIYTPQFFSWQGWAYAALYDTITAGFTNQYSTAAGTGATNIAEERYALAYIMDAAVVRRSDLAPFSPRKCLFTNNTYAYLSMKNGDAFAKKFGGPTGNDPDFFKIIIRGYRNGQQADTTSFYLADFRFSNNSQDYIIKNWTTFNFPPAFQNALFDSLLFEMASSDVGQFGINTPTYFCMDEFEYSLEPTAVLPHTEISEVKVYPNPVKDKIYLTSAQGKVSSIVVTDAQGRQVLTHEAIQIDDSPIISLDVNRLPSGIYMLHVHTNRAIITKKVQKL